LIIQALIAFNPDYPGAGIAFMVIRKHNQARIASQTLRFGVLHAF